MKRRRTRKRRAAPVPRQTPALVPLDADGDLEPQRREVRARSARVVVEPTRADYLRTPLRLLPDRILDGSGRAVMMRWEEPIMRAHADALRCAGADVLNIGFGMGLIDGAISDAAPRSHTIVEAHPDILAAMRSAGWTARATIVDGRWQVWPCPLPSPACSSMPAPRRHATPVRPRRSGCATSARLMPSSTTPSTRVSTPSTSSARRSPRSCDRAAPSRGSTASAATRPALTPQRASARRASSTQSGAPSLSRARSPSLSPRVASRPCDGARRRLPADPAARHRLECRYQLMPIEAPPADEWEGVRGRYYALDAYLLPTATWADRTSEPGASGASEPARRE